MTNEIVLKTVKDGKEIFLVFSSSLIPDGQIAEKNKNDEQIDFTVNRFAVSLKKDPDGGYQLYSGKNKLENQTIELVSISEKNKKNVSQDETPDLIYNKKGKKFIATLATEDEIKKIRALEEIPNDRPTAAETARRETITKNIEEAQRAQGEADNKKAQEPDTENKLEIQGEEKERLEEARHAAVAAAQEPVSTAAGVVAQVSNNDVPVPKKVSANAMKFLDYIAAHRKIEQPAKLKDPAVIAFLKEKLAPHMKEGAPLITKNGTVTAATFKAIGDYQEANGLRRGALGVVTAEHMVTGESSTLAKAFDKLGGTHTFVVKPNDVTELASATLKAMTQVKDAAEKSDRIMIATSKGIQSVPVGDSKVKAYVAALSSGESEPVNIKKIQRFQDLMGVPRGTKMSASNLRNLITTVARQSVAPSEEEKDVQVAETKQPAKKAARPSAVG